MLGQRRDIRPTLLNFGVALAISLAGILYSILRSKRISSPRSPPSTHSSDSGNKIDEEEDVAGLKSDDHSQKKSPYSSNDMPEKHESSSFSKVWVDNLGTTPYTNTRSHGDKDGFLLPEFDEPVKGFDLAAVKAGISPRKDVEVRITNAGTPKGCKFGDDDEHEQELRSLKNMVRVLKEREMSLEIQLLEYYGLKEQESTVMELQNQLKINSVDAKIFTLKIKSLQEDKRRLQAQVADHANVLVELEAAKAKIKQLRKKLISEAEQNKEQILNLQKKVINLQDQEQKSVSISSDIHSKIQKLEDLEHEAEVLRKANHSLNLENSELSRRLEYVQILATSALGGEEAEAVKQEFHHLMQQNDELSREIEQLHADRCSELEELVYLRWMNACLRYELRNFQPSPGKTIARDLSKTLSPRSEEKAKQLILEYADKEDESEKGIHSMDFDYDRWSSSQSSHLTDSGEFEDSYIDNSSSKKTRTKKIFSKLIRIIRGKDGHHRNQSSLETTALVDDAVGIHASDSPGRCSAVSTNVDAGTSGLGTRSKSASYYSSRHSLDHQRSSYSGRSRTTKFEDSNPLEHVRSKSDGGSLYVYRKIGSIAETGNDSPENPLREGPDYVKKSKLVKYAEALRNSHSKTSKPGKRSATFSSF